MIDFVNFRSVSMANVGHFRPQNSICLGFEMSSFSFPVFDLLVFFFFLPIFPRGFSIFHFSGIRINEIGNRILIIFMDSSKLATVDALLAAVAGGGGGLG